MLGQCAIVVPTVGRPSLHVLLDALATAAGPRPAELLIVDDRPAGEPLDVPRDGLPPVRVVRTGGAGPAPARNLGWRSPRSEWNAFLHDNLVPEPVLYKPVDDDVDGLPGDVALR